MADHPDTREEREHYAAKHERFAYWMDWTLVTYGIVPLRKDQFVDAPRLRWLPAGGRT